LVGAFAEARESRKDDQPHKQGCRGEIAKERIFARISILGRRRSPEHWVLLCALRRVMKCHDFLLSLMGKKELFSFMAAQVSYPRKSDQKGKKGARKPDVLLPE
jgi:hypothetical protein